MGSLSLETLVGEVMIFGFPQFQNKLMKLRMGGTALGLQDILSPSLSLELSQSHLLSDETLPG